MSDELRLVVFDVDGTLVDSQADILGAMAAAFDHAGLARPDRSAVLSIVGLSLEVAMRRLAPAASEADVTEMVEVYKDSYASLRRGKGTQLSAPLYPDAREVIDELSRRSNLLLGLATGKSRRGLTHLLEGHGLTKTFVTEQVADFHPSKPHPSMLHAALLDSGCDAANAVMIGDTSFDMEMGKAAGLRTIGVTWGYHSADQLIAADTLIHEFAQLPAVLDKLWG